MNIKDFIRPDLLKLVPYSSARSEHKELGGIFLDANENPYETGLNRYPDPYQTELKSEISKLKGIDPGRIFLGNGSDEAIDLIIRLFCRPGQDSILIAEPTYGMYKVSADINQVAVETCSLTENFDLDANTFLKAVSPSSKIIFLCTPNNPSGNLLNKEAIKRVLENFEGIVVIDEAYIDFSSEESWLSSLDNHGNLIVIQTFSKAWGLAGIRLGMAFASSEIIEFLNSIKPPYNLSTLVQNTAIEYLTNKAKEVKNKVYKLIEERTKLAESLNQLSIVEHVYPSDSNFLLAKVEDATGLYKALIERGILVRNRSNVHLCEGCLRVTVGTADENAALITEIENYQR